MSPELAAWREDVSAVARTIVDEWEARKLPVVSPKGE